MLGDFPPESTRRVRYLKNLVDSESRGKGRWRECLWRPYDRLQAQGLTGYRPPVAPPVHPQPWGTNWY